MICLRLERLSWLRKVGPRSAVAPGQTDFQLRSPSLVNLARTAMTVLCRLGVHSRPFVAAAPRKLCAFGDQGVDNVRECLGRATVLSMNRAGLMLAFLAVPAIAIGVSGSVRIGLIVAVVEFGFQVLLRRRRQPG